MYSEYSEEVRSEVLLGVVVAREDGERVSVDFDVSAKGHVGWGDELAAIVDVLVLSALQELAFDDTRVLLRGLVDRDTIISQIERDDEAAVEVLWHSRIEAGCVAEDLLVVVDALEEVAFRLVWH